MNIFAKGLFRLALKAAGLSQAFSLTDPQLGQMLARMGGGKSWAGKAVTEEVALQIMTVWCCVRILAETIGSLPWQFYERRSNGDSVPIVHDLTAVLMGTPNSEMTDVEFKEAKVTNLALRGNGYSVKELRKDGSVISLFPVRSEDVIVRRRQSDLAIYFSINDRGKWEDFPRERVWQVKGFGGDGLVGYSPIGYARQSLGLASATEEFQARFFANGASPGFIVRTEKWLDDPQREKARKNLNNLWTGLANAHKLQLLEGGMDIKDVTMPLDEAQFLELRGLSVEEICRLFRMPPHMVQKLDRSTNNNIEQQSLEFVMYTLRPWLKRIESSAARWLLPPADRSRIFLRFDVDSLLQADSAARSDLYSKYVNNGIMTRNEVRAIEKLPRSTAPGADELTAQIALAPIDLLRAVAMRVATQQKPDQGKGKSSEDPEVDRLLLLLENLSVQRLQ